MAVLDVAHWCDVVLGVGHCYSDQGEQVQTTALEMNLSVAVDAAAADVAADAAADAADDAPGLPVCKVVPAEHDTEQAVLGLAAQASLTAACRACWAVGTALSPLTLLKQALAD